MLTDEEKRPQCPHCGERFAKLRDGAIPTHNYPKPCRSVCRGSGNPPKAHEDTPLWKDDRKQEERDFIEAARMELRLYGFAVVKQVATLRGGGSGKMDCPLCGKPLKYLVSPNNGHCAARCRTVDCINAME